MSAQEDPPLFPSPPAKRFGLSERFASHAGPATYRPSSSRQPCDECLALQHQTGGRSGPRAPVKCVRTAHRLGAILLCGPHKELWVELDAAA